MTPPVMPVQLRLLSVHHRRSRIIARPTHPTNMLAGNRQAIPQLPVADPLAVLTVHGLLGDAQPLRDLLPGPAELARVLHLEDLQAFGERPERRHRAEPDIGVAAGGALGDL